MSLPPEAAWKYDWQPQPDSPEALLYQDYLKPRQWV
jgi:coproporphyrinogen III oxidase